MVSLKNEDFILDINDQLLKGIVAKSLFSTLWRMLWYSLADSIELSRCRWLSGTD